MFDISVLGTVMNISPSTNERMSNASETIRCPVCRTRIVNGARFCPHCGSKAADVKHDRLIGTTVARRYRIMKSIASGGMGQVYLGVHAELGQRVAVKVLHRRFADDEQVVARFLNEARYHCKVSHPYAVAFYDYGRLKDGTLYMVMEYVDGVSLKKFLKQNISLSGDQAIRIAQQVCEALAQAHSQKIVHRDVKPDNIMIVEGAGRRLSVKVLDFGIAKLLDDDANSLTQAGTTYGTPEYMSPEQASGKKLDQRTDIYAVGMLIYAMLAGHPPFYGKNSLALLRQQIQEPPPPLAQNTKSPISNDFITLVHRAIAKDPNERPQTMEKFLEYLELVETGKPLPDFRARNQNVKSQSAKNQIANADTAALNKSQLVRENREDNFISDPSEEFSFEDNNDDPMTDDFVFEDFNSAKEQTDEFTFDEDFSEEDFSEMSGMIETHDEFGDIRSSKSQSSKSRSPYITISVIVALIATVIIALMFVRADTKRTNAQAEASEIEAVQSVEENETEAVLSAEENETVGETNEIQPIPSFEETSHEPARRETSRRGPWIARIQAGHDALNQGNLSEAQQIAAEIRQNHPNLSNLDLTALDGDIHWLIEQQAATERYLAADECMHADNTVIAIRERIGRPFATVFYGRLDACRNARQARESTRAPVRVPEPTPEPEPVRQAEPTPEPEPARQAEPTPEPEPVRQAEPVQNILPDEL